MKEILEILNELHNHKVGFCLQSQPDSEYYNLKVGKEHYIHSNDLQEIKKELTMMWGSLIGSKTTAIKTSAPSSIPLPPPMPPPC